MKEQETYKEVRVFESPDAVIRVFVPELTEEERERRYREVCRAVERLLREK